MLRIENIYNQPVLFSGLLIVLDIVIERISDLIRMENYNFLQYQNLIKIYLMHCGSNDWSIS